MPLEHYVPRWYLKNFAPENEGLVSRYSLVEKHGGGDYHLPKESYPISKAGAVEDLADGWFENDETSSVEKEWNETVRKLINDEPLEEDDIGCLSQFIAFQNSRLPQSILHYEARQQLQETSVGYELEKLPEHFDEAWKKRALS